MQQQKPTVQTFIHSSNPQVLDLTAVVLYVEGPNSVGKCHQKTKLTVRLGDHTGHISLVLWEDVANQLHVKRGDIIQINNAWCQFNTYSCVSEISGVRQMNQIKVLQPNSNEDTQRLWNWFAHINVYRTTAHVLLVHHSHLNPPIYIGCDKNDCIAQSDDDITCYNGHDITVPTVHYALHITIQDSAHANARRELMLFDEVAAQLLNNICPGDFAMLDHTKQEELLTQLIGHTFNCSVRTTQCGGAAVESISNLQTSATNCATECAQSETSSLNA